MNKVMVVDDAAFMRLTIKNMLSKNGFDVVGEAENGAQAIQKCAELQPDIITMDITMPEMTGIDALKEIMKINPKVNVCLLYTSRTSGQSYTITMRFSSYWKTYPGF